MTKLHATPGLTEKVVFPVIAFTASSVAVNVWLPEVFMVALKTPTPLIKVVSAGICTVASL